MRKHFLLLFLMAVLPLAGWAQTDLSLGSIVITSPYFGNVPAPADIKVYNQINQLLTKNTDYTFDGYFSDNQCQTELTEEQAKAANAGTTVYVKVTGMDSYMNSLIGSYTIKKMPLVLIGTPGTKAYGTSGAETIFTFGEGSSVKTKYNVGAAVADLTSTLKTQIDFTRDLDPNVGAYAISGAFKSTAAATYKNNYTIASADILSTAVGNPQAKYTITQRTFKDTDADATVTITVSGNLTYNGSAQEATVTVVDKIAALGTLTRGYVYETVAEYNAAHPTAPVADLTELNGKTIAERTKTPGDYFLTFASNTNAGNASVTITGMGNYAAGAIAAKNFTINPAPLFVTPSAEKVYDGNSNLPDEPVNGDTKTAQAITHVVANTSTAKFNFQGFVDDKDATDIVIKTTSAPYVAPEWGWVGTATANVGTDYAIQITTDVNKGFVLDNYTFIGLEGTFKITQKNVTAVADDVELNYGDPEVFALTAGSLSQKATVADGTALTDAIKIVKGAQIPAGKPNEGKYPLTPAYKTDEEIDADEAIDNRINAAVDADNINYPTPAEKAAAKATLIPAAKAAAKAAKANYTLNAGAGQAAASVGYLTINKAPLYIGLKESAYTLNKVYDGQNVQFTLNTTDGLTIVGKKGSDVINVANLDFEVENNDSKVGLYTIRLSGADADNANYAITYIPSQYQITPKDLKITVYDQTFITGATTLAGNLYQIDATDGLASTDQASEVFKLALVAGVTSAKYANPGDYDTDAFSANKFVAVPQNADATHNLGWAGGVFANGIDVVASNVDPTKTKYGNYTVIVTKGDVTVIAAAGTITLDDTQNMKATLAAANGTAKNVTFTSSRNLTANSWNVMVLPFDIKVSDLSRDLGYAVIDVMDEDATDGNVHFNIYMGTIKANTPFMFKVDGQYQNLNQVVFAGKTIVYDTTNPAGKVAIDADGNSSVTDKAGNKLIGVYKSGTAIADGWYYFGKDKTTQLPSWVPASNAQPSKGERALLVLNNTSAARIFVEEPNGTVTEIETINADGVAVAKDGWFTLNGVKLQGMPTEKGIYINNGKKVVVK